MHILERVENYVEEIKEKPYIYKIQKLGIEIFKNYINANGLDIREEDFHKELLDKLILLWIPRTKKYLSEAEVYQVIYTIHDIYNYINKEKEISTILEVYGEEYMRIYKAKNLLQKMTKDPVISVDPIVIDLAKYKEKKKKSNYGEIATTYEQALFEVEECKEGGQVILNKVAQGKTYKLLLEYPAYKYLKKGDLIHAIIKRRLFYVYWEFEEVRAYYLPQAVELLNLT
ncbi:MAG: hypothetical protein J6F30_04475 [Cellulosilyticum sp.]|nr:hypothetical protein [Cellulosilyticum sp.]